MVINDKHSDRDQSMTELQDEDAFGRGGGSTAVECQFSIHPCHGTAQGARPKQQALGGGQGVTVHVEFESRS